MLVDSSTLQPVLQIQCKVTPRHDVLILAYRNTQSFMDNRRALLVMNKVIGFLYIYNLWSNECARVVTMTELKMAYLLQCEVT